jgi:hypothetical protein
MYTFLEDSAGISDVPGFKASGVGCDIRRKNNERLDVALVYSELPCVAAGTFHDERREAVPPCGSTWRTWPPGALPRDHRQQRQRQRLHRRGRRGPTPWKWRA